MPGIEPATCWLEVRHADDSANEKVSNDNPLAMLSIKQEVLPVESGDYFHFPQREAKDYPVSLGVTCVQHVSRY